MKGDKRLMKHICYVVAMQEEASPFIEHYNVELVKDAFKPLPCVLYQRHLENDVVLSVVINGQQHGSALVGCEAAAITTLKAIETLSPDIVINSGTCGAFSSKGANIADVYIGNGVMFHDRRVPGDDAWGTQALGNYSLYNKSAEIANILNLKMGKVTTGSSLDMQPCDLEIINENGGELKDMEAAAVAFVCSLHNVPCMLVKSVTDLVDGTEKTYEEFRKNLGMASKALAETNVRIIDTLVNTIF